MPNPRNQGPYNRLVQGPTSEALRNPVTDSRHDEWNDRRRFPGGKAEKVAERLLALMILKNGTPVEVEVVHLVLKTTGIVVTCRDAIDISETFC